MDKKITEWDDSMRCDKSTSTSINSSAHINDGIIINKQS